MRQRNFKLNTSAVATLFENDQRIMVTIPANALVTFVDGDIDGKGFVRVHYLNKLFDMFAQDLRTHGERMWGQSA
jgi:hypothetical protein